VTLRPHVGVKAGTDLKAAEAIHHRIHEVCFIARSVNFPVDYAPTFEMAD
jgi:organic hydroperoxide reductase OsmC/OhrA